MGGMRSLNLMNFLSFFYTLNCLVCEPAVGDVLIFSSESEQRLGHADVIGKIHMYKHGISLEQSPMTFVNKCTPTYHDNNKRTPSTLLSENPATITCSA